MSTAVAEQGLALLLDQDGRVSAILRHTLRTATPVSGMPFHEWVGSLDAPKALELLARIRQVAAVFDWEMAVPEVDGPAVILHFAAAAIPTGVIVIGAPSRGALELLSDELMRINNEQANALRTAEKEVVQAREDRPDDWLFEELTQVNNSLANLQRELAQRNAELERTNALIDLANDAIMVRDLDHRIRFCNRGAACLYGWPQEELVGQLEPEALFQDPQVFHEAVAAFAAEGEWTGELVQHTRAGSPVTVLSRWTPLRDNQGRPSSVLVISTDISERKAYERQMLRGQRMESIGTLAGGIAHDLNNVLTPILMSVNLLRDGEHDAARLQTLDLIATSAQRGADMVRQVLSFARGFEGSRVPVDVVQLVHDVAKIVSETMLKAIDIQVDVPSHLRPVQGDTTQLEQVLLNLCVNARDAMPGGGRLLLKAEGAELDGISVAMHPGAAPGHHVVLTVEDTGTGMPPGIVDRIFDPFFTTKEQGKGTGLGLSTSQAIVKSHGGFMRVYSEPGRGSAFRVYLPATEARSAETEPRPRTEHPRGRGEVILVVDDEPTIREITRRTLEAYGYQVLTAADGAAAIALYSGRHEGITAVLTDMMMPGMGGREMIQVLHQINPGVKVVAASGLSSARDLPSGMHSVVGAFLQKPYTAAELLSAIRAVVEAP